MIRKLNLTFEKLKVNNRYGEVVAVNPGGTVLPARYKDHADAIYNFEYRRDDIALITLPKSGTTWTAEILWAMNHINELQRAYSEHTNHRVFILDNDFLHDMKVDIEIEKLKSKVREVIHKDEGVVLRLASLEEGPRIIWSHLPFNLLNPSLLDKCKVVYVMRHPKDNLFSLCNHATRVTEDTPPLEDLFSKMAENFMAGRSIYGSCWHHIREAWQRKDHPNLHLMFYEDMKADIASELRKLDGFLELRLTDQQLQRVVDHTSFNNMKSHPTMSPDISGFKGSFLNKGQVGSSKGILPPELEARMDTWIKENALKVDAGFKYAS